ncbi:Uncharacterised protein [Yersinia enterocolitica]|nr:hypothetical protein IOK_03696 [Yersinia enterocolitica subsp. palearctica PhRBD_Ye1]CFW59134.1 Uncharacterised protein [Yersinia enterocolitica]CRX71400.1 Uncharacterised protein [Yersinia enterocolitica]CRX82283.1 Uncharacterised protein [Yersinia enterocolitica]CRY17754.1 Uncharacterised protein [Yersinia enterocolitica]
MDIAGGGIGVGDNSVFAIYCAVVELEEAFRLVIPVHKTAFRGVALALR